MNNNFFKKIFKKQQGSAMIMALMAAVGIAILSVVVLNSKKADTNNQIRLTAEKDLEQAALKVATLYATPSNCNANFYSAPLAGDAQTGFIKSCSSGLCRGGPNIVNEIPIINRSNSSENLKWKKSETGISERVRVVRVQYLVAQQQSENPQKAARLEITVTFQLNLGDKVTGTSTKQKLTRLQTRTFEAYVKTRNWIGPPTVWTNLSAIAGCTKSPNSSTVY